MSMRRRRRRLATFAPIAIAAALALALSGCGIDVPHSISLADRCADIMRAAMPAADIAIDKRTSQSVGLDKIIARVAGTRTDVPKGSSAPRDLAAECEFDDGILYAFRWTKGGPPPRPP
jgi:hypothetical protein